MLKLPDFFSFLSAHDVLHLISELQVSSCGHYINPDAQFIVIYSIPIDTQIFYSTVYMI
uniref:Uncharacterized protein n=2 Tax=Aegilops tauschii subsp. strangulata TaxID=200361 RepID=A0A453FA04_AEGTS